MKKIIAIIRTSKIEDVAEGLEMVGVKFFTYSEVKGHGMEKRDDLAYRGVPYDSGFIPRTQIEVVVADDQVDEILETIQKNASTGKIGDGKIIVHDVEKFIRIRSGETGTDAL